MAEEAEKTEKSEKSEKKRRKAQPAPEQDATPAPRLQDMKAGELLRHVRLEKGLELEEISSAIHVRVAQLRAIEEGHIEALPGMTYALGFVRSYASHLKLDAGSVVNSFKAEHGMAPAKPDLKFPEPIAEGKMPDPVMIGAAVLCVLVLVIAWAIFADGDDRAITVATNIPPPPPKADMGPIAPAAPPVAASIAAPAAPVAAVPPAAPVAATPAAETATAPAATPTVAAAPAAVTPAETPAAETPAAPAETPAAPAAAETAAAAPVALPRAAPTPEEQQAAALRAQQETINIRRGGTRVMIEARQTTWVQITDARGAVVLKKVLRPGDRYYVPDEPGYSLITSNAGGLNVSVDGRQVQPIGRTGEIVRGMPLDPNRLSAKRGRVRVHD
jgi:cytoskeleton protein RodZ